eukprot:1151776-Pelagomonas_calceolata.AAC.1
MAERAHCSQAACQTVRVMESWRAVTRRIGEAPGSAPVALGPLANVCLVATPPPPPSAPDVATPVAPAGLATALGLAHAAPVAAGGVGSDGLTFFFLAILISAAATPAVVQLLGCCLCCQGCLAAGPSFSEDGPLTPVAVPRLLFALPGLPVACRGAKAQFHLWRGEWEGRAFKPGFLWWPVLQAFCSTRV